MPSTKSVSQSFQIQTSRPDVDIDYDVSADGQRFIANLSIPGTAAPPTVVLNWTAALKQ